VEEEKIRREEERCANLEATHCRKKESAAKMQSSSRKNIKSDEQPETTAR
jgi:hypothetical protein